MLAKPTMWWPGLRRQDSLARGTIDYWPFWENSGSGVDNLIDRKRTGTLSGATWKPGPIGPGVDFGTSGGSENVSLPIDIAAGLSECTQTIVFQITTIANGTIWSQDEHSSLTVVSGELRWGLRLGGEGADRFATTTTGLVAGLLYVMAGRWDMVSRDMELFLNGEQVAFNGGGPNVVLNTTGNISLLGNRPALNLSFPGAIYGSWWHNRKLTDDEIAEQTFDAFSLIRPDTQAIAVEVAAGGGVKLIGRGGPMIGAGGGLIA